MCLSLGTGKKISLLLAVGHLEVDNIDICDGICFKVISVFPYMEIYTKLSTLSSNKNAVTG